MIYNESQFLTSPSFLRFYGPFISPLQCSSSSGILKCLSDPGDTAYIDQKVTGEYFQHALLMAEL